MLEVKEKYVILYIINGDNSSTYMWNIGKKNIVKLLKQILEKGAEKYDVSVYNFGG